MKNLTWDEAVFSVISIISLSLVPTRILPWIENKSQSFSNSGDFRVEHNGNKSTTLLQMRDEFLSNMTESRRFDRRFQCFFSYVVLKNRTDIQLFIIKRKRLNTLSSWKPGLKNVIILFRFPSIYKTSCAFAFTQVDSK